MNFYKPLNKGRGIFDNVVKSSDGNKDTYYDVLPPAYHLASNLNSIQ